MNNPWVDIVGYASRRGTVAYNLALSQRRIDAIKHYLSSRVRGINFQTEKALGETESGPLESDNSGYWRAADVSVFETRPPKKQPPPPPETTQFEIRVVGGGSASLVLQADNYFFQIVDVVRKTTAFYMFTGLGFGISIPKIPGPGSVTKAGPPTRFRTMRPAHLYMFNSTADLTQEPGATFLDKSAGGTMGLFIKEITDGTSTIRTMPYPIPVEGGPGIQMPGVGSVTKGVLAKISPDYPFSGY